MIAAVFLLALAQAAPRHPPTRPPAAKAPAAKPPVAGRAAPARPFDAIAKEAAAARDAGKSDEALELYRQAVRQRPSFAEGWWWLGTLYYSQENWVECRRSFTRFTAQMPKAGPGYALLGICDFKAKDYAAAVQHLDRAEALGLPPDDPNTREARYYFAAALNKAENFERALMVLAGVALSTEPSPEIVLLTGIAALRKPITPDELPPEDRAVAIRAGRAVITAAQRKPVEARQLFDDVIADFPDTPNLHYIYGAYLLALDADRAVDELNAELRRQPDHVPSLVSLAMEYLRRGDLPLAKASAERAVKAAPGNFAARTALGRALTDSGEIPGAIRELEFAVKLAPDSPQAQLALASAYAKAGRKEDAARARAEFARLKGLADKSTAR